MAEEIGEIPVELERRLVSFDEAVSEAEEILKNVQKVPFSEIQAQLSSLDRAKLDLVGAYAMNSLFWMYLTMRGENPKDHAVKQELDRIRTYMVRVKEIENKQAAPKLDVGASKRFLRNALWNAAQTGATPPTVKRKSTDGNVTPCSSSPAAAAAATTSETSRDADVAEQPSLKKKKKKNHKKKAPVVD